MTGGQSHSDATLDRRLAAILSADVVGYSGLVEANEEGAVRAVRQLWQNIVEPAARSTGGRIVKTMGDGVLVEFNSAVNAVRCAMNLQDATATGETAFPDGIHLVLRIGVHLGDVLIDGDDILGDGVNLAARLEGLADPGGVCISGAVHDQLGRDLANAFADMGRKTVKNIARPVQVYMLQPAASDPRAQPAVASAAEDKPTLALGDFTSLTGDDTAVMISQGCQQMSAALLSGLTGLRLVSPSNAPAYLASAQFQIAGARCRCLLRLVQTSDDAPVIGDRLDCEIDDPFEAQDILSARITTAIRYAVLEHEAKKAARRIGANASPEERLTLAGHYLMGSKKEEWAMARDLLRAYTAEQPHDFMGFAMLACAELDELICGVCHVSPEDAKLARDHLERARQLKDRSDFLHLIRASYFYGVENDVEAATRAGDRCFEINPDYPLAYLGKAQLLTATGHAEEALAIFETITPMLNQNRVFSRILANQANSHFVLGDHDAAYDTAQRALEREPHYAKPLAVASAAAALLGREAQAQNVMTKLLAEVPQLASDRLRPFTREDSEPWRLFRSGLVKAGMPD